MSGGRKPRLDRGPYDIFEIARRIERRRQTLGIPAKRMAQALGLYESGWSKKVNCRGSTFTVEEISAIWAMLGGQSGWPFVCDELSAFLDHHLGRSPAAQVGGEYRANRRLSSPSVRMHRPKSVSKAR